jgi:N-methylhydantoinase B
MAAGEGGNTVVCIGGYHPGTREPFILVDMINGAWGGRVDQDGIEGVTNPSQNMSNLPVETLEARYPVRIEEFGYRADSCGAGRYRGGVGLVRTYTLLADEALLQLRSDRTHHAPYGLFGGEPGGKTLNVFNPDGNAEILSGKATRTMRRGDTLRHEQAGAGGYGDPLERDPELVARDARNGKITDAYARERHGVVLKDAFAVDAAATAELRGTMRAPGRRPGPVRGTWRWLTSACTASLSTRPPFRPCGWMRRSRRAAAPVSAASASGGTGLTRSGSPRPGKPCRRPACRCPRYARAPP